MKKIYIQPSTETVHVRLIGSVLNDGIPIGGGSPETNEGVAKQNDFNWDDNDSFMVDLWADDEDEEY